ncbi:hypothetical protein TH25_14620 [Thalassospira profundimaris]|uniref:DUF6468 domain-containing protein n=1 Tax=Thalassospira profundimaris TaxID=502049 RepID=A0A367X3Q6_9PROT|nr:DUF6468 domain-containing protein [Thalassospira profundimaris]RCK48295.1 hypothetical protein TH25_14620 [Thalassospira profundimaris]
MDFEFYLDLLMIVLLVATIIYALMLNRRLAAFRRNREEMEQFLSAFHAATERAEILIQSLKDMASQSGDALREDIERASGLHEDLSFMVDRGDAIANRLEKAASSANAARKGSVAPEAGYSGNASTSGAKTAPDDRDDRVGIETRAEELAARLVRDTEMKSGRNAYDSGNGRNTGSDERGGTPPSREDRRANILDDDDADEDAGRSEAERELLAALRSVR